jgi:murein endopeptidase
MNNVQVSLKILAVKVGFVTQMTQIVATALVDFHVPLQLVIHNECLFAALYFAHERSTLMESFVIFELVHVEEHATANVTWNFAIVSVVKLASKKYKKVQDQINPKIKKRPLLTIRLTCDSKDYFC